MSALKTYQVSAVIETFFIVSTRDFLLSALDFFQLKHPKSSILALGNIVERLLLAQNDHWSDSKNKTTTLMSFYFADLHLHFNLHFML
jgi:hypothetical protein